MMVFSSSKFYLTPNVIALPVPEMSTHHSWSEERKWSVMTNKSIVQRLAIT